MSTIIQNQNRTPRPMNPAARALLEGQRQIEAERAQIIGFERAANNAKDAGYLSRLGFIDRIRARLARKFAYVFAHELLEELEQRKIIVEDRADEAHEVVERRLCPENF